MSMQRCPKCNKILSPQESVCSNCGARLDNHAIGRINSIYRKSNGITLIYLAIFRNCTDIWFCQLDSGRNCFCSPYCNIGLFYFH